MSPIRLGLRENLGQFSLLVLVNAFVGAMVGLERALLPLLAENSFGVASRTAILSFIVSFGLAKAAANYFSGAACDQLGRKPILVAGWLVGLPVPLLLIAAPTWSWVVLANLLLGFNQGMTWSATVIMKIDLVGPRHRGLASGMGAQAVAIAWIAASSGLGRFAVASLLLGLGTAMVYPTLLAAIGDGAHTSWRASAVGVYRLWRDAGYAVGALTSGVIADFFGVRSAIGFASALTLASGILVAWRMRETKAVLRFSST